MFAFGGLWLVLSIALATHALRTGRHLAWLLVLFVLGPLGALIYIAVEVVPELLGSPRVRRAGAGALRTLDPGHEYREAKAALEETPTVRNQARLAAAAASLGRHAEAEALYRQAAHGVHARDPALLLGLATALLELGRPAEALEALGQISDEPTPADTLLMGRAHDALGHTAEAEGALRRAAETVPGFEGQARYAAFLAHHGRQAEARAILTDIDQRLRKAPPHARHEARPWRDLAARALQG